MRAAEAERPHTVRSRIGVALLWLAVLGLLLGMFALAGGSFGFRLGPLRVSLRNPINPLLAAVVAGGVAFRLIGPTLARRQLLLARIRLAAGSTPIAAIAACLLFVVTLRMGSTVAAGADASGYLNEARLLATGAVKMAVPLARELPLRNDLQPFAPLGFRPAIAGDAVVPTYPPGLPLALALARRVAGEQAQFVVVPVCAAGIVLTAFAFGRRIAGPEVGLLGAAATATSPTLLFQSLQPMSDVPAAFWWMLSMLLLTFSSRPAGLAAGGAAAIAALTRPNLFAIAPIVALCVVWWPGGARQRLLRAALYALPVGVGLLAFLAWQRALYGGATETGYGGVGSLFALEHVWPNLARYPIWLTQLHTPLVLLAIAGPLLIARDYVAPQLPRDTSARLAWSALAIFGALTAFYLLYIVFEDWTYVRFLLPALPLLLILAAIPIVSAAIRLAGSAAGVAIAAAIVLVATLGVTRAARHDVFRLRQSDERILAVADVARMLPASSVFLSMFHSGSLTYYGGHTTLRWDWVEADEVDNAIARLAAGGRPVFVVLDAGEEPVFRARFAGTRMLRQLRLIRDVTTTPGNKAAVYAAAVDQPGDAAPPTGMSPAIGQR